MANYKIEKDYMWYEKYKNPSRNGRGGENFSIWRLRICIALLVKGVWVVLDSTSTFLVALDTTCKDEKSEESSSLQFKKRKKASGSII